MTRQLSSSSPPLNHLGGELAIRLEEYGVIRVVTQHIPGVLNVEPDWLSRAHDRDPEIPANLSKVKIKQLAPICEEDFVLQPLQAENSPWEGIHPATQRVGVSQSVSGVGSDQVRTAEKPRS